MRKISLRYRKSGLVYNSRAIGYRFTSVLPTKSLSMFENRINNRCRRPRGLLSRNFRNLVTRGRGQTNSRRRSEMPATFDLSLVKSGYSISRIIEGNRACSVRVTSILLTSCPKLSFSRHEYTIRTHQLQSNGRNCNWMILHLWTLMPSRTSATLIIADIVSDA